MITEQFRREFENKLRLGYDIYSRSFFNGAGKLVYFLKCSIKDDFLECLTKINLIPYTD